jgi:hypothetical protein
MEMLQNSRTAQATDWEARQKHASFYQTQIGSLSRQAWQDRLLG